MAEGRLSVRVVSPKEVVYEGEATALVAPAWDGHVGILPGHAPLLTLVGAGELTIHVPDGGTELFHVSGGVLKVLRDQTTILTEYAGTEPGPNGSAKGLAELDDTIEASKGNPLV
ncbi:MAG: ATP synthase F1 subunit epsilon [Gemmatimonadota bacterium]